MCVKLSHANYSRSILYHPNTMVVITGNARGQHCLLLRSVRRSHSIYIKVSQTSSSAGSVILYKLIWCHYRRRHSFLFKFKKKKKKRKTVNIYKVNRTYQTKKYQTKDCLYIFCFGRNFVISHLSGTLCNIMCVRNNGVAFTWR